jgi:hypothetical protein
MSTTLPDFAKKNKNQTPSSEIRKKIFCGTRVAKSYKTNESSSRFCSFCSGLFFLIKKNPQRPWPHFTRMNSWKREPARQFSTGLCYSFLFCCSFVFFLPFFFSLCTMLQKTFQKTFLTVSSLLRLRLRPARSARTCRRSRCSEARKWPSHLWEIEP